LAARAAREHRWPLTTHVAESAEEFEMFMRRRGPLHDWLQGQRDMSDCDCSPVQHLERCGYLGENLLAVHLNYLWRDDREILAQRKVNVAHCPRSHAFFGHAPFPYRELAEAGINIALGTDSLASVRKIGRQLPELNMFAEMQALAAQRADLSPTTILNMATVNGAAALGWKGLLGELSPGALADFIWVPFTGKLTESEERVVQYSGQIGGPIINGHRLQNTWAGISTPSSPASSLG
jgi:cytosine/adenosine deaminase-related metal-dependent hydrolase